MASERMAAGKSASAQAPVRVGAVSRSAALYALQRRAGNRAATAAVQYASRRGGATGEMQCNRQSELHAGVQRSSLEPLTSLEVSLGDDMPMIRQGSSGEPVRILQSALNSASAVTGVELVPDGVFGQITDSAVRAFQQGVGLQPVDGIVGRDTWSVIEENSLIGAAGTPAPAGQKPSVGTDSPPAPKVGGGTDGEGGVFASAPFGCVYPNQEEKEASRTTPGFMQEESPTSFILGNFANDSSALKPGHKDGLSQLVSRFQLGSPTSNNKVTIIEGITDCAGGFEKNVGLRRLRALETKVELIRKDGGALPDNVPADPVAGFFTSQPGDNKTAEGRSLNRAVRVVITPKPGTEPVEVPAPTGTDPGPGLCTSGVKSKNWELTSHVSASGEAGVIGVTGTNFTLKNVDSGVRFPAVFFGISGGLSTPIEIQVAVPSATGFTTVPEVCPSDFDGPASIVTKVSASIPALPLPIGPGKMIGDIIFGSVTTVPAGIDIGSIQVGTGASTGIAGGNFFVFESLGF